ncbi:TNF receptor-associated factor 2 isoform X2 [Manis pentadactyla]|uniref:TNF receptor-associated factor 2 isoform X2 n=1 Tax=Manis pentadactyla TaxID=143292 RepID=UPI00255CF4CF|nr:TNF receptor-associated factor 2 isoform X2 [Manis pentadactyla]
MFLGFVWLVIAWCTAGLWGISREACWEHSTDLVCARRRPQGWGACSGKHSALGTTAASPACSQNGELWPQQPSPAACQCAFSEWQGHSEGACEALCSLQSAATAVQGSPEDGSSCGHCCGAADSTGASCSSPPLLSRLPFPRCPLACRTCCSASCVHLESGLESDSLRCSGVWIPDPTTPLLTPSQRVSPAVPRPCPAFFLDRCCRGPRLGPFLLRTRRACLWLAVSSRRSCHEGHCPFMLTECPACKGLVRLGQKEQHSEQECPERSLSCRHCRAPCCWADLKAHHEVCPKFPLTCNGCGKKKISREKFQDHVRTCGKCRAPCRFHAVGCPELVESEKRQEHEAQRLREHLAMLLGAVLEAEHLPGGGSPLGQSKGPWEAGRPGPGVELSKAEELMQRCEALERKTATFENIVCVLNREVERVAMTAEACGRQHRLDQDRIETLSNQVQQLERSIGLKDLAMADLEQKVHDMEASTFDGVFIWKISDFARKRQEAVAGRTPAIFSPAFYTSRYGYKMCLRVYLNGDGTGRGTHLSLFFVVMKGPNDALLRWPFNQKRPVSDMNIASGCPLFCPVSKMEAKTSYVRDDAIFIKAIVDLTGL